MTEDKVNARTEVAQASRILALEGVVDAFGHASCRTPGSTATFLMSKAKAPALVDPEDVIELDLMGEPVESHGARVFLERFIHAEIYRARPDVNAIVHSHSPHVLPFTVVPGVGVKPICHTCGFLRDTAAPFDVAEFNGDGTNLLIGDSTLGGHFARHLSDRTVALMRSHGFTAVGSSVPEAVFNAIYTARNCQIQLAASALGAPRYLSDGEAIACEIATRGQADRAWSLWLHALSRAE